MAPAVSVGLWRDGYCVEGVVAFVGPGALGRLCIGSLQAYGGNVRWWVASGCFFAVECALDVAEL